jgi:beta-glucanase (GH16 family)
MRVNISLTTTLKILFFFSGSNLYSQAVLGDKCDEITLNESSNKLSKPCNTFKVVLTEDGSCNDNPWVLIFEDNFDSGVLNSQNWGIQGWGQGALSGGENQEYNSLDNAAVDNGLLSIEARREDVIRRAISWKQDNDTLLDGLPNLRSYEYTSSNLWSKKKFDYGMLEMRCRLAPGLGFSQAFWMFEGNPWNEIDVFEFVNDNTKHIMTSHYDLDRDGNTSDPGTNEGDDCESCAEYYTGPDFSDDFHVFTLVWDPYYMEWYVDGVLKRRIEKFRSNILGQIVDCSSIEAYQTYIMERSFPNKPMHIIMNLAVRSGVQAPHNQGTVLPASMDIDYVRYYQRLDCQGNVVISDLSDLNLSSDKYNVLLAESVIFENGVQFGSNDQLAVIARDKVLFNQGFLINSSSNFISRISPDVCLSKKSNFIFHENIDTTLVEEDGVNDNNVEIYPNPVEETFNVLLYGDKSYKILLYDMLGSLKQEKLSNKNIENINVSSYSKGLYLIKIFDNLGNLIHNQKVIIE